MTALTEEQAGWETSFVGGSRFADGSAIIRPDQVAWTPGPWDGAFFKLTHIDRESGMWTAVLRLDANGAIPPLHAFGEVQIYVLAGSLVTESATLGINDYFLDTSGTAPARRAGPEGVTYFAVFAGGLSAVDEAGEVTGPFIDGGHMYAKAKANSAADFLPPPNAH